MNIDGPIKEDPTDPRFGYRISDVPDEDAYLMPMGDVVGEWVRCGSSCIPKGPGTYQLEEKFIRREEDLTEIAFEKGRKEGYQEAIKDVLSRDWNDLELLRDEVILSARAGDAERVKAAIAALDAKTGYKPHHE